MTNNDDWTLLVKIEDGEIYLEIDNPEEPYTSTVLIPPALIDDLVDARSYVEPAHG